MSDCTGGFDAKQVTASEDIVCGQDGLFGFVGLGSDFLRINADALSQEPSVSKGLGSHLPSIPQLLTGYRSGAFSVAQVICHVYNTIDKYDKTVWIHQRSREDALAAAEALCKQYDGKPLPPLFGVPFAVKDNIDVLGVPTTAAYPSFAYTASANARVVDLLLEEGAIFMGKLNMDQLATGLSGCRSPYGTPHCFYSTDHIPGGSSSGSAVAVAAGLVSFSLGTDTAGSGRVPAALNGVIGLTPTKGTVSCRGVVPACKSLDTVSVFAPSVSDARRVWLSINKHDPLDPYAKPRSSLPTWHVNFRGPAGNGFKFGIPSLTALDVCSPAYRAQFDLFVQLLASPACGGKLVDIDYTPFAKAGALLYDATLVMERIASIGPDIIRNGLAKKELHPTTAAIFTAAMNRGCSAWDVFSDQARQTEYTRQAQNLFDPMQLNNGRGIDILVIPTTPCHPTIAEMEADPLKLNARLGTFTHAATVVDLCGVTINAGRVVDAETGRSLPFGVTLLGGRGYDAKIHVLAQWIVENANFGRES